MKRTAIGLCMAMVLSALPVSVSASIEITDNRDSSATAEFSESDFETRDYFYVSEYGRQMGFVAVKNNSGANVEITVNAQAYDAGGKLLGSDDAGISVLGPGENSIAVLSFYDIDVPIDHFEYTMEYERSGYFGVISDLSASVSLNASNATLVVTNDGERPAQFVNGIVLFLDANDNVVGYDINFFNDDDGELKPGAALSAQYDCNKSFDHVECYFNGYSDGRIPKVSQREVDEAKFDVKEFVYNSGFRSVQHFLVITNNSDQTVHVSGNATALDGAGRIIGAANCEISVLGPEETSICDFYFSDAGYAFDHADHQLTYKTEDYYKPVIKDLSAKAILNDRNVVMSVTNNGSAAAKYVEAYVLFMDADNNVIHVDSKYAADDDGEIKPGATINFQLNTYDPFDHIEAYFTGHG